MEHTKQHTGAGALMTQGSIAGRLFFFAVPLILGNLLQQLYNTADSVIVGNFIGSRALAAVGAGTSLINLIISFATGVATGTGVVVSQYLGAKMHDGVKTAVHTAFAIALILGVTLSLGGALLARPLLIWMDTPEEVLPDAVGYLRIYFGGLVFSILYNMAAGILNAAGNSRRSLLYLACASVTNIALDLLFIEVLNFGVAGAAWATNISQLLSGALAVAFLIKTKEPYRLTLREIRLDRPMARRIIRIGLPAGVQSMVISLSNVLIQSSVNRFGADAMAGFVAYMKIDGFNILPVTSLSLAITTFVGQNYGAGRMDRVRRGMWVALAMTVAYTAATGALLMLFSDPIMRLFTSDDPVVAFGELAMRYFCPFYPLLGALHSLGGTVRGTGHSVPPMVILLSTFCLFRMLWLWFILPLIGTMDGVLVIYPVSWLLGLILMALYTWKGRWREAPADA